MLTDTFKKYLSDYEVLKLEGTYLVWVDIHKSGLKSDVLAEKLLHDGKVQVNSGMMYGKTAGENYIRINIACTRATLQEGLNRIIKGTFPLVKIWCLCIYCQTPNGKFFR